MSIPTGTTGNTHSKRFKVKGDGRSDEFVQMLPHPVHDWDYWAVMPAVEARLEQDRAARAEAEKQENYRRTMDALGKLREVKAEHLPWGRIKRIRKERQSFYDWDALESIMIELRARGMTFKEIGKELDLDTSTVHAHLKKRGVA